MQLLYSQTSPYARTVRLVIAHHKLEELIDLIPADPFGRREELQAINPLGKIPALVRQGGDVLYDSIVINQYLDRLGQQETLFPVDQNEWPIRRSYALAIGVIDAALNLVMELRRPKQEQSSGWCERWQENILTAVAVIGEDYQKLPDQLSIAHLAIVTACDYLSFRLPSIDWRGINPSLTSFVESELTHQAFRVTDPRIDI
ncbi:MAG: glutathione S-transferase N-terminal domain-containing protein [bacterium]